VTEPDLTVPIASDADILTARQLGRQVAARAGFGEGDQTVIAAAISEVARNIVRYATRGEIILRPINHGPRKGLTVVARDEGPGIPDLRLAMQDGYSTGNGFGVGLPGTRRLMDEFEIVSEVGRGTTVTLRKWARP
jgi:serine/threonine-protein kinase RsbT